MTGDDSSMLRARWTDLYSVVLPNLARARDPAQSRWPVTLDHCFARIILDNTIGRGEEQWDKVLRRPAVRNMSDTELRSAIDLGEKIRNGEVDLVELDKRSLAARGKGGVKYKDVNKSSDTQKRKHLDADPELSDTVKSTPQKKQKQSTLSFLSKSPQQVGDSTPFSGPSSSKAIPSATDPAISHILSRIARHPDLTPYRKRLYSTLLSVPLGCYTTYAAMATYLESSARAVGSGMRNNPFAPDVPCHRVLAADGSIGGFKGSWGVDGTHASKKIDLLAEEGVKFDTRGKVKGPVFRDLEDLSKATHQ